MMKVLRLLGVATVLGCAVSALTPVWNYAGGILAMSPVIDKADAIIVLGAGGLTGDKLGMESLRRAVYGIQLFKRQLAPVIVFCGPAPEGGRRTEADVRSDLAMEFGIPFEEIVRIGKVTTTRDEASQSVSALRQRRVSTILLVTEPLHMRRAAAVFAAVGFKVLPALSDNSPEFARAPDRRLELMFSVLRQSAAIAYYRVAGYI